jgi:DNA repair protein RecO (recombination protein O)
MEWRDEGLVIGVRRQGEAHVVLELLTRAHGRHLGLVRGGRSSRQRPVLQPGNTIAAVWRARLDEHLGSFQIEPLRLDAARLMGSALALFGLASFTALARLLPERDPHPGLYETAAILIAALDDPALAGPLMVRFELALLAELGFGLDLSQCAVTGSREALAYVSPRSGRAVSAAAGEPWRTRLLPLPAFLQEGQGRALPGADEVAAGLCLTETFLNRFVFAARGLPVPPARAAFITELSRAAR